MVEELSRALFFAGVPVAAISYLLTWWALKKQYLHGETTLKGVESHFKSVSKARSRRKKEKKEWRKKGVAEHVAEPDKQEIQKMNPVFEKWLSFGGGFYGVVGLLTYAVVELGEISDFFNRFDGVSSLISDITPNLFIGLFINSITNFIVAIAWPVYWLRDIHSDHIWIWFVIAYAAYEAGTRLALKKGS